MPSGDLQFRRGVSQTPTLGSVLYLANQGDVKSVYAISSRSQITVGSLHSDPNVAARVSIDDLLCKHLALVGTTGVGKSCALTLMLTRILEQSPNGHVLLLDPHNEYGNAFGDRAEHLTVDTFPLPFWLTSFEEMVEIVFGASKHEMVAEIVLLRDLIRDAKVKFSSPSDASWITMDSPVPYSLGIVNRQIDTALDNRSEIPAYQRIKSRLAMLQADRRYGFMFDTGINTRDGAVADVVEIGWWRSLWFVQRTISGVRAPAETTPWKRIARRRMQTARRCLPGTPGLTRSRRASGSGCAGSSRN